MSLLTPLETNRISILFIAPNPKDLDQYHRALKDYQTLFVSEQALVLSAAKKKVWDIVIIGDHLEAQPLAFVEKLKKNFASDPAVILILKTGQEKLAIEALENGIQEYLFQDNLVPSIIHLIVNKCLEQKKWQRIFETSQQKIISTTELPSSNNIFNQNFLEMRLVEEVKRSQRYQFPVSILLVEMSGLSDDLRFLEPSFALKAIHHQAAILAKNIRSSDMLGILNNGFLGIVLPHTNVTQAKAAWERLNKILSQHPFLHGDQNVFVVSKGHLCELNAKMLNIDQIVQDIMNSHAQEETTELPLEDLNS